MVHDMYLFEVKKPSESKGEWDLYKLLATVPGDEAFRPLDKGGCPLVEANEACAGCQRRGPMMPKHVRHTVGMRRLERDFQLWRE